MPRFGSLCSSKKRLRASPSASGSRISPDTTTPGSRGSRKTWTSSGAPLLTTCAAAICEAPILRPTSFFVRLSVVALRGFEPASRRRPKRRGSGTNAGAGSCRSGSGTSTAKLSAASRRPKATGAGGSACTGDSGSGADSGVGSDSTSWPYAARRSITSASNETLVSSSSSEAGSSRSVASSYPSRCSSSIRRSRRGAVRSRQKQELPRPHPERRARRSARAFRRADPSGSTPREPPPA